MMDDLSVSKSRWFQYFSLSAVYFGTSFMWNALHPIVLPVLLLSYGSEATKNTRLGVLTFTGLILAMISQPLWGALSDATKHRMGKRSPWIIAGCLASILCLATIGAAHRLWLLALGYLALQVVSNAILGAGNGLIPDAVPPERRGHAVGVKSLLDMAGIIAAALVAGVLMRGESPSAAGPMLVISVVLVISAAATVWGARSRVRTDDRTRERNGPTFRDALGTVPRHPIVRTVRLFKEEPQYGTLLLSRFWMLLSSYLVQSFGLYYLRDVVQVPDPANAMSQLMTYIGVSLLVVVLPAGIVSQRWGRKVPSLAACGIMAVCVALLLGARDMAMIRLLGIATGIGMGIFVSVNWAWATDLAPSGTAATYLGLANLATAGSSALSRLGGPVIDLVNRWHPTLGYTLVFGLAVVSSLFALYLTLRVPETQGARAVLTPVDALPAEESGGR